MLTRRTRTSACKATNTPKPPQPVMPSTPVTMPPSSETKMRLLGKWGAHALKQQVQGRQVHKGQPKGEGGHGETNASTRRTHVKLTTPVFCRTLAPTSICELRSCPKSCGAAITLRGQVW